MDRKEYLKQWRLKNNEKVKEYQALYFQANKEAINQQRNYREKETGYHHIYVEQKRECVCGKTLKVKSLYNHRKICLAYQSSLTLKPIEEESN